MDRRQKKTRQLIFSAFTELLSHKKYSAITVGEIIERADVGRATFYSHFETKDFLLKELCEELFCHVFDCLEGNTNGHSHIFGCDSKDDIFLHLLRHFADNDNNISTLLSGDNNEIFRNYFKDELKKLLMNQKYITEIAKEKKLPEQFWINHIAGCFVETVKWGLEDRNKYTPEEIHGFFLRLLGIG